MSVTIGLIRHGPTAWNRDRRLQGRSDIPLDTAGRQAVFTWRLPPSLRAWHILSSPLSRARETAEIVTGAKPEIDDRLIETDFGEWEGETLSALRQQLGPEMKAREDRGRDFCAPGGESPNDLINRLTPCYEDIAKSGRNTLIFCHKGIIRATMAWATGWNMLGKAPMKLHPATAYIYTLSPSGAPQPICDVVSLAEAKP